MNKKEIIEFIQSNQPTPVHVIKNQFQIESRGKLKRFERIMKELIHDKMVSLNHETHSYSLLGLEAKQKKEVRTLPVNQKPPRVNLFDKLKDATQDTENIINQYNIRREFSASALKEAEAVEPVILPNEIKNRLDLRNRMVVTIDGEDAKDLDDAVSIEKKGDLWILGVHIADVSYYVSQGSKLDIEASKRANSFYFINKVIPMFPKILSNGICSLNPNEDRLTLSIFMHIDDQGKVHSYEINESVIHSKHRLTYNTVQDYLSGLKKFDDQALNESLDEMDQLFRILNKKRLQEGSIDFDFKEQKCTLDDKDEPLKIWLKERQDSERLIEEFMLIANQCIAKYLSHKGPSLYRIHGEPETERIQDFIRITLKFGHKIYGVPVPDAKEFQRILEEVKNKPHKELVNHILLRSMQQARYDTDNIGHFGLGFEFYTHFTSPIRRYADLIIHRLVKHFINKRENQIYSQEELDKIAAHISKMERTAMEAERDLYKIKAIRFMESRIGKEFDGLITGVSSFGIFVQIKMFGVEGLVRYQDLEDDYYIYDEKNYCAVGKRTKNRYTMGDPVKIEVMKVNIARGFLDLKIIQN